MRVRYDGRGLRGSTEARSDTVSETMLTLGCSWTEGAQMPAESTFTEVAARRANVVGMNGGVGGYGLSQVVIKARRVVPDVRPDYLIVQYSTWLVARSIVYYAPSLYARQPTPYFVRSAGGAVSIHEPLFYRRDLELQTTRYRTGPRTAGNFASFFFRIGIPFFADNTLEYWFERAQFISGEHEPPTTDRLAVVDYAYREIAKVCERNGTRLVILILEDEPPPPEEIALLHRIPNALVVDAISPLLAQLPKPTEEAFDLRFTFVRGDPPIVYDLHPNARTHGMMGEILGAAIASDRERRGIREDGDLARAVSIGGTLRSPSDP